MYVLRFHRRLSFIPQHFIAGPTWPSFCTSVLNVSLSCIMIAFSDFLLFSKKYRGRWTVKNSPGWGEGTFWEQQKNVVFYIETHALSLSNEHKCLLDFLLEGPQCYFCRGIAGVEEDTKNLRSDEWTPKWGHRDSEGGREIEGKRWMKK